MSSVRQNASGEAVPIAIDDASVWQVFGIWRRRQRIVWLFTFALLVAGCLLIGFDEWISGLFPTKWSQFIEDISRELGMACLVAAVVGVALDWIAFGSGRFKSEIRLEERLEALKGTVTELDELRNPMLALERRLGQLFPEEKYNKFNGSLLELAREVDGLRDAHKAGKIDDANITHRLELIGWFVETFPTHAAHRLTSMQTEGGTNLEPRPFAVPGRYELTRHFLAMQLDSLASGDELCSVANVMLYRGIDKATDPYLKATREAVANKVKIRRVFNLIDLRPQDRLEAAKVIKYQMEAFADPGNFFRCRFLTDNVAIDPDILDQMRRVIPATASLGQLYYALFIRNGAEYYFYRTEEAIDQRRLHTGVVKIAQGEDVPTYHRLFEQLWNTSSPDNPLKDQCA